MRNVKNSVAPSQSCSGRPRHVPHPFGAEPGVSWQGTCFHMDPQVARAEQIRGMRLAIGYNRAEVGQVFFVSSFVSRPNHPYRYRVVSRRVAESCKKGSNQRNTFVKADPCLSLSYSVRRSAYVGPTKWHGRGHRFDPDQVHQTNPHK
jgi:hypothetical protein